MTSASASAPQPSGLAKLLASLNATFSDPSSAGLTGFAQGLLQASAPHMLTPVSGGQALGMGAAASQDYQRAALQNALQRAVLPFTVAKTQTALNFLNGGGSQSQGQTALPSDSQIGSLGSLDFTGNGTPPARGGTQNQAGISQLLAKAQQRAIAEQYAGLDPTKDPFIVEAITAAKNAVTPFNQPANTATTSALNASRGGLPLVRGPAPAGSVQSPATGAISTAPGALPAIAGASGAQAGGAAAATYPYDIREKVAGYFKRSPGEAGGFNLPMPPLFNPAWQSGSQPPPSGGAPGPNPSAPGSLAAQKEANATPQGRARLAAALRAATQGAGTQPQGARPILPAPNAQQPVGSGLTSPGLSPAQVELQKQAAQHTGAQEAEGAKETEAANQQLARLSEMQNALTQIPVGGNFAKVYQGIGDVLNYAGIKLPGMDAIQEFSKYRTNFVADAARKMGAKVSYQEVGYIAKGVPDFTLQGNAPRALIAQLQGAAQYDITRNQARLQYESKVPNPYGKAYQGTDRGFEQWWQKSGVTPGALMFMNTLFALPPADRAEYLQNFRSTSTGKVYLQQYAKGQAFLRSNPQLAPFWSSQQ